MMCKIGKLTQISANGSTRSLGGGQRHADPRVPDKHAMQTHVGQSCANILMVGKAQFTGLGEHLR